MYQYIKKKKGVKNPKVLQISRPVTRPFYNSTKKLTNMSLGYKRSTENQAIAQFEEPPV